MARLGIAVFWIAVFIAGRFVYYSITGPPLKPTEVVLKLVIAAAVILFGWIVRCVLGTQNLGKPNGSNSAPGPPKEPQS